MKKYLIIFAIVLITVVAAFIYFTKDDITFSKETSVYKAIPITAPLFIETSSIKAISEENQILNDLETAEIAPSFFYFTNQVNSLVEANQDISKGIRNEPFVVFFSFSGKNELFPVFIKKIQSNSKKQQTELLIKSLYPSESNTYTEANYNGHKTVEIRNKAGLAVFQYSFTTGLLIASPKSILVEEAIRQLSNPGISNNPYFTNVNKTVTSQSEISCLINHKQFPDWLAQIVNRNTGNESNEFGKEVRINFATVLKEFSAFAAWTELDVTLKENLIRLSGISSSDDSLQHYLSVFDDQSPVRFNADKVLPKNTSYYFSASFADKEKFFENLENYFKHSGNYYSREDQIQQIENSLGINFKESFQGLVNSEIIVAASVIPVNPNDKITYFIVETEGKTAAKNVVDEFFANYYKKNNIEQGSLESIFSVDNETRFAVYKFPYPSLPKIWLGQPFSLAKAAYLAWHDNYLVFCSSKEGLHEYLHSMVLDASLAKDINYLRFKENVESRANISAFININRAFSWQKELLNNEIAKLILEKEEFVRKFGMANWQLINNKNIYFNSVVVSYDEMAKEDAQTTWQSNIGSQIANKPVIVKNHNDTQNAEVLVQGNNNEIYLITKDGRVRWNAPVDGNILSEIFEIDYYRNGKIQYLFNTKNKLYLIDRNGNNVAQFPVVFRSPSTNGVNVFDYDNNRKYRYFVACEDKKVYAYDAEGNMVNGWNFGKTDFVVTTPVQHFRVANKDYIVFKDKSRIYIQDRRGETRVNVQKQFENSRNQLVLNQNGNAKIVTTEKNGTTYYINFDGEVTEKIKGKYSENHFFACDDINGNGIPDFIFVDGKELEVFDENGKKLYAYKFKNEIQHPPHIYTFSQAIKKVGIVDSKGNRIYLFNPDGKLHDGFPLHGNTEFSIGKISQTQAQLNLVVGNEGGDLYNYTLN